MYCTRAVSVPAFWFGCALKPILNKVCVTEVRLEDLRPVPRNPSTQQIVQDHLGYIMSSRAARASYPDSHPPLNRLVTLLVRRGTCTRPVDSLPAQPQMHPKQPSQCKSPLSPSNSRTLRGRKGHTVTALPQTLPSQSSSSLARLSFPVLFGLETGYWGASGWGGFKWP